jgi:hypothetical protein
MTDHEHADAIRKCIGDLHKAVRAARKAGLTVELDLPAFVVLGEERKADILQADCGLCFLLSILTAIFAAMRMSACGTSRPFVASMGFGRCWRHGIWSEVVSLPNILMRQAKLLVIEHTVAGNFLRGQWHAFGWGLIEDRSTHAPAKERFDRLQGLVGGDRRAPLLDGGDDLNNIALANLVDAPAGPRPAHLTTKEPGNLAPGAVL